MFLELGLGLLLRLHAPGEPVLAGLRRVSDGGIAVHVLGERGNGKSKKYRERDGVTHGGALAQDDKPDHNNRASLAQDATLTGPPRCGYRSERGRTMRTATCDERGLVEVTTGDGRPLLALTGFCLMLAGAFAALQSITGEFLPHDVRYLGMTARHLCQVNECRVVHFMIHDRVSFGGAIFAVGVLYIWLATFPLRRGEAWAWWLFLVSGGIGFGSFFTYLGYGYLDTWHAAATLALLLCYVAGLLRSYPMLRGPLG